MTLGTVEFSNIPGLSTFRAVGLSLLSLAVLLQFLKQSFELIRGGSCDFITPLIKAAFIGIIVSNIQFFGTAVAEVANELAKAVGPGAEFAGLRIALQSSLVDIGEDSWLPSISSFFSMRAVMAVGFSWIVMLMYLAKIFVLDLLWPVCFSMVMILGTIGLPIGLMPGMGGFSGWIKNVVEVSLWPVVFAMLTALLAATAKNIGSPEAVVAAVFSPESGGAEASVSAIFNLLRLAATCLLYIFILLFSPVIAMLATRGTPIGLVAGVAAQGALGLAVTGAGKALDRLAIGPRVAGLGHYGLNSMRRASGKLGSLLGDAPGRSFSLDQRNNPSPKQPSAPGPR